MPLFLKHKLLFIHIPKCGGSTVTEGLRNVGDPPFLFVSDGSVMMNGHTPQHTTWQELQKAGWHTPPGFRVAALVRHPVERTLSAFRYIHKARSDLAPFAKNPAEFLDHFLSKEPENVLRFDNHNKSTMEFLINANGQVNSEIYIQPISNLRIWASDLNLPPSIAEMRINNTDETAAQTHFSSSDIQRISDFYAEDINWFEARFAHPSQVL
jgi:hypothetical protein